MGTYDSITYDEKLSVLIERIEKNLADYHDSLVGFGKRELIDMAGKINAMADAHEYMTSTHEFEEDELQFYLQFQNPLEIIANEWHDRNTYIDGLGDVICNLSDDKDALADYPLMSNLDTITGNNQCRFMGVDLIDFLGNIADKTIIHYPGDWQADKAQLIKAAVSPNPEDKRLLWHCCSTGTHIKSERDVFVKDSGAFEYWTDYHQNDSDMFGYAIEVTGSDGQVVTGNVFEVGNYAEHAKSVCETALPLDNITLKYSDKWGVNAGKTITVSRREYDDERRKLMCDSGDVVGVRFNPADENELNELLQCERRIRMSFPIGSMDAHLSKLTQKLAEIRTPPEQLGVMTELKQRLLIQELAQAGFPNARYIPEKNRIKVEPDNSNMPEIFDNGDITYGRDFSDIIRNNIMSIVDMVNEVTTAWDKASPIESVPNFRALLEYNDIVLAVRDDTEKGYGMHYVTWMYNREHTAVEHGHYTTNLDTAKQDFVTRAGLLPVGKVLTPELAAEIVVAVGCRIAYDETISLATEGKLNSFIENLKTIYPDVAALHENSEKSDSRDTQKHTKKPSLLAQVKSHTKSQRPPSVTNNKDDLEL